MLKVSGYQHPEKIGQKPRAVGPVDLQPALHFLDPVLRMSSLAINAVDLFRSVLEVGGYNTPLG